MTDNSTSPPQNAESLKKGSALSATFDEVLRLSDGRGTSLNDVLSLMSDRGVALFMVIFAAPFLIPVSIPGLSTSFGAVLTLCGIFTALARPVRLPQRLGSRWLPHASLERSLRILRRICAKLERVLHPRLDWLSTNPRILRIHGAYVFVMAVVLAIPFPTVPFIGSNAIAAWPIFLLGMGLLERDGLFITIAYLWALVFVAYWIFFYAALLELWRAIGSAVSG